MKRVGILLLLSIFLFAGSYLIYQTKGERVIVEANYLMLACEKCLHMEVINSDDKSMIGEAIIPESGSVNISELINKLAISKLSACLSGRFYKYSPNILHLTPAGKRFEVLSIEPETSCKKR